MSNIDYRDFERVKMRLRVKRGINLEKVELIAKILVSKKLFHTKKCQTPTAHHH